MFGPASLQSANKASWRQCRSNPRRASGLAPIKRGRRAHVSDAGSSDRSGDDSSTPVAGPSQDWDSITDRMVGSASVPFSILVLPQVLQNFANISAGNPAALSIISWEGYLSGLVGNTLMCGHFSGTRERSAVLVQILGMANNILVLGQLAFVLAMPMAVFLPAASISILAACLGLANLNDKLGGFKGFPPGFTLWQSWQLLIGIAGMSVVPQVMYNILVPAHPSILPGLMTATGLVAFLAYKFGSTESEEEFGSMVESLPGWAATLLFALSPLPQLVKNFVDTSSLEGLSVATMLLALIGNMLMVPRAMLTRDRVWFAGTVWASSAGWGQLLSLCVGTSVTGARFLDQNVFFAITAVIVGYFVFIAKTDAKAKNLPSVRATVAQILFR